MARKVSLQRAELKEEVQDQDLAGSCQRIQWPRSIPSLARLTTMGFRSNVLPVFLCSLRVCKGLPLSDVVPVICSRC